MKCPYCGAEMEKGVIQSIREIFWSYHKRKIFLMPNKDKDDVVIAPDNLISGSVKEAFRCNNCKKIIIDFDTNQL